MDTIEALKEITEEIRRYHTELREALSTKTGNSQFDLGYAVAGNSAITFIENLVGIMDKHLTK